MLVKVDRETISQRHITGYCSEDYNSKIHHRILYLAMWVVDTASLQYPVILVVDTAS